MATRWIHQHASGGAGGGASGIGHSFVGEIVDDFDDSDVGSRQSHAKKQLHNVR
jgi:hypothetical protein